MYPSRAVDKQLRRWIFQRLQRKVHAALKYLGRLRLEVVVRLIPEDLNPVRFRMLRVVALDLHVDNVRDPRLRHLRHVIRVPDSAADRNPVVQPRYIHPQPAPFDSDMIARPELLPDIPPYIPKTLDRRA